MAQTKTILITPMVDLAFRGMTTTTNTVKMASLLPRTVDSEVVTAAVTAEDESIAVPRKRQRLTHLSLEEKILRRKLKNRVAAQSARDRKKARMQDLEEEVRLLEKENSSLTTENELLHSRNDELEKENAELRRRLGLEVVELVNIKQEASEVQSTPEHNRCSSVEYASLISDPLPKGQEQAAVALWMILFAGWLIVNLMTSPRYFKNSKTLETTGPSLTSLTIPTRNKMNVKPMKKWWGPQQQSWNPSKN